MTRHVITMTPKSAEVFDARPDRDWLNPISMSKLQVAVKTREKTVILNDREFAIEYGILGYSKVLNSTYECICLRRVDGELAPFGYLSVKRIEEFTFEKEKKRK